MGVDNLNEEKMDELLRMMRSVVPDISDMTDAGRIGFVTRGQYSGAESYENLDVVLYGGSLWTPKKDTTGNPPPETQRNEDGTPASNEFWQLFLPGALGDDYVKKTDIAKAPTETESGKPGVNFPDGKTIQIDENGMLTGTPLDFMGTWKELQDGIASGEITEGMIGYIEGTSDNPEDPDHPNNFLFDIDDFLSTVSSNAVQNRIVTASLNRLEQLENETRALRASLESFGLVKIAPVDLVDVTEDNGLVLGAKEKNPTIKGTLGNKIENLQNEKNYLLSGGTKISAHEDLNYYKNIGNYYCESNTEVETLLNCPISRAFTMKVEYPAGVTIYLSQTIRDFEDGSVYYRMFDSTMWRDWTKKY